MFFTFVFQIELVSFNPSEEPTEIDVEMDTVEIEAADEEKAVEGLKERFNISLPHRAQSLANFQCYGCIEEEKF